MEKIKLLIRLIAICFISYILYTIVMNLMVDNKKEFVTKCSKLRNSKISGIVESKNRLASKHNIPEIWIKDLKSDSIFDWSIFHVKLYDKVEVDDTLIKREGWEYICIHKINRIDTFRFSCDYDLL